jgi:hypothetical protein
MLEFFGSISPCNLLFDRFRYDSGVPSLVKLRGIVPENMLLERSNISKDRLPNDQGMLPSNAFEDMLT